MKLFLRIFQYTYLILCTIVQDKIHTFIFPLKGFYMDRKFHTCSHITILYNDSKVIDPFLTTKVVKNLFKMCLVTQLYILG